MLYVLLHGGVVNTSIILAAAEGIIGARYPGRLKREGGDLILTKDWAKSLMKCMGFVRGRCLMQEKSLFLNLRS